jgi:nucleoside-diphosphate-sugar epimerase
MTATARETVLVTGSSGFIGRKVLLRLAERYGVVGLDRDLPQQQTSPKFVCIDIESDQSVAQALQRVRVAYGENIASVIHLAAYFDLTGKPNRSYEQVTVRGTERLIRALRAFHVEQFVFASSMLIHAPAQLGQRIDEDWPLEPKALPYRESKIHAERVIREQRGHIPAVLIRPAGVYDDRGHSAFLAHQIARIFERKLIAHVYPGDLDTGQSYLHVDDLTEALLRIVERRGDLPPELAVLLGEPETLTTRELQDAIGRLIHGEKWDTYEIPKVVGRAGAWLEEQLLEEDPFVRPWMVDAASDHYELDISRARRFLSWEPRHSLRATLPTIVAALEADPPAWYRTNKLNSAVVADRAPEVAGHKAPEEHADPEKMMRAHSAHMRDMHLSTLWVHFANVMLGAWLAVSPFALGLFEPHAFTDTIMRVTASGVSPTRRSACSGSPGATWSRARPSYSSVRCHCRGAFRGPSGRTGLRECGCCSRHLYSGLPAPRSTPKTRSSGRS